MLKNAFLMLLSLAIAIGGGGASVWYALKIQDGVGAIRIGQWTAFPDIGTPAADPYSKARVAREGVLALGRAEGLSFVAETDAAGDQLKRECSYRIEGGFPTARFWTLYAADQSLGVVETGKPGILGHCSELAYLSLLRGNLIRITLPSERARGAQESNCAKLGGAAAAHQRDGEDEQTDYFNSAIRSHAGSSGGLGSCGSGD